MKIRDISIKIRDIYILEIIEISLLKKTYLYFFTNRDISNFNSLKRYL